MSEHASPAPPVEIAWVAKLNGHLFDMEDLAHWTHGNQIHVKKVDQEQYALVLPFTEVGRDHKQAKARAQAHLTSLNGALTFLEPGYRPIELAGGMSTVDAQGVPRGVYLEVHGAESRSKAGRLGLAVNGVTQPDPTLGAAGRICELAERSVAVRDALLLVGRPQPLWSELYIAMELVKANCSAELQHSGWIDPRLYDLFCHTANSFTALGVLGRHGPRKGKPLMPPPNPMTQQEATRLIRGLVHEWIKTQV